MLCVRAWTVRVSVDFAGHWVVRFSLVVGWTARSCGYVVFCHVLSLGLPRNVLRRLTRGWVSSLAENGMKYQIIRSLNRTNALYNMVLPSLFGEMDLHPTKLAPFRGQR